MPKKPLHERGANAIVADLLSGGIKQLMRDLANSANCGDELAKRLLYRLWRYGVTDPFLYELREHTRDIQVPRRPELDRETRKFYWQSQWLPAQTVTQKAAYSLIVVFVINAEKADQIRRCKAAVKRKGKATPCDRYFFGAANKQWCSERCGSRVRVQAKRKRDKEGGML